MMNYDGKVFKRINSFSKKVKKLLTDFTKIFFWLFYLFSKFFPKDENLWLFGADNKNSFEGNSKYLFLYLQQLKPKDIKSFWITNNKKLISELKERGYSVLYYRSLKGVYYCLRAKVWFYNHYSSDISFWFSGGAFKVNLWHGTPIKKIAWDFKKGNIIRYPKNILKKLINRIIYPPIFQKPDLILSTSKRAAENFKTAFKLTDKQIIISGNPRNDIFFQDIEGFDINCDSLYNKLELLRKTNKIIFYMPTYREKTSKKFYNYFAFDRLERFLEKHNLIFIIKPHPWDVLGAFDKVKNRRRIYFVSKNKDPYPILKFTDILITDYSSVFIDFLLLNRFIVFFPYDINEYQKNEREFYYDYEKITPGKKVMNYNELEQVLLEYLEGEDNYVMKRKESLSFFFDVSGISSPHIYNKIKGLLKNE